MKRFVLAVLFALTACGGAANDDRPVVAPHLVAGPGAPRGPYVPPPPFSVVAHAPGDLVFEVFSTDDGDALIGVGERVDRRRIRWARARGTTIEPMPELRGLPDPVGLGTILDDIPEVPIVARMAGRGGELWLGVQHPGTGHLPGGPIGSPDRCEVFHLEANRWVSRGAADGQCRRMVSWSPGSVLVDTGNIHVMHQVLLRAFGEHGPMPALPALPAGSECLEFELRETRFNAFATGEVVVVQTTCHERDITVYRWAPGATSPTVQQAPLLASEVSSNAYGAYEVEIPSPVEVRVDGWSKAAPESPIRWTARFDGRRYVDERLEQRDIVYTEVHRAEEVGIFGDSDPVDGAGFDIGYSVGTDEYRVVGIFRGGVRVETQLLRNRPVDRPLAIEH